MAAERGPSPRPTLRISCSPDADDLFMFRAIQLGLVELPGYQVELQNAPTNELNELASRGELDVVAISIAHYPRIADDYLLLPHGGSLGEGYGPVLVAREPISPADLAGRRVAIPGLNTTAWTVLRMLVDVEPVVTPITPYELLFERLRSGEVDAALVIHEGRLTFEQHGFVALADLGVVWRDISGGLPLPLGGNAIRRDLGEAIPLISDALRASIAHGLEHRDEAIDWLLQRGGPLDRAALDQYLGMYANQRTLDYGPDGRVAVEVLLEQAAALGIVPECEVEWAP